MDPEAIRPLATSSTHGLDPAALVMLGGPGAAGGAGSKRQAPGAEFDISKLAPPLKGQKK